VGHGEHGCILDSRDSSDYRASGSSRSLIHMGDEELLTSAEVAKRLRVDRRTVARWTREGRLTPAWTTPGGFRRYRWSEVREQLGLREPRDPGPD
jgi:excisionase family DNA binding protein